MLKQLLLLFTFFCCTVVLSQEVTNSKEYHSQLLTELDGIYQIQLINSRAKPAISTEMLQFIKNNQQDSEQVTIQYTSIIRIVILPRDAVNNGQQFLQEEQITYISE